MRTKEKRELSFAAITPNAYETGKTQWRREMNITEIQYKERALRRVSLE